MITLWSRATRRIRSGGSGDDGFAMILTIGFGVILVLVGTTLLDYTVRSLKTSRREQDYQAAVAVAQAGVDDYLSRLNANNTYWQTTDCTNIAMRRPFTGTVPCGWGSGTAIGWVTVPGATSPTNVSCATTPLPPGCGQFHYDVDSSKTLSTGTVTLKSTGRVASISRTVQVDIQRMGFADFLYYSDIESVDPTNRYVYGVNNNTALTQCSRHYWDNPPRNTSYCSDIYFVGRDNINGPLHTNDALLITGAPTFNGPVSTAYPNCAPAPNGTPPPATSCYRNGGSAAPILAKGISYASAIQLPPTNGALRAQATTATAVGTPGCMYTGPTRIRFNSGGTMTVWSPYSNTTNTGCGGVRPNPQTVNVPNNNVVFVQNVPSGQSNPSPGNCSSGSIGGYPQSGDANISYGEYDCRAGTVFVDGVLSGRVTIGADNDILIVANLTHQGGPNGSDSLGLVANNSVEIYHPISCTDWDGSTCDDGNNMNRPSGAGTFTNPVVHAAMLSLGHSFGVQLYPLGNPLGTLTIFGSIAQKYRGAVGTFSGSSSNSGYDKAYSYDTRLKFAPPPFYLDPVQSAYGPATFAEIKAQY